jgi:hypothetical protein
MIGTKNVGRIFGVCLAVMYTTLVAVAVSGLWPSLHAGLTVLILLGLAVGFYFTGIWVALDRPAELKKKISINSKQLKRRKKEFYDWLTAQGRH